MKLPWHTRLTLIVVMAAVAAVVAGLLGCGGSLELATTATGTPPDSTSITNGNVIPADARTPDLVRWYDHEQGVACYGIRSTSSISCVHVQHPTTTP